MISYDTLTLCHRLVYEIETRMSVPFSRALSLTHVQNYNGLISFADYRRRRRQPLQPPPCRLCHGCNAINLLPFLTSRAFLLPLERERES